MDVALAHREVVSGPVYFRSLGVVELAPVRLLPSSLSRQCSLSLSMLLW